jgi:hypothetical protein
MTHSRSLKVCSPKCWVPDTAASAQCPAAAHAAPSTAGSRQGPPWAISSAARHSVASRYPSALSCSGSWCRRGRVSVLARRRLQRPHVACDLPQPPPRGGRLGGVPAMPIVAIAPPLGFARPRRAIFLRPDLFAVIVASLADARTRRALEDSGERHRPERSRRALIFR